MAIGTFSALPPEIHVNIATYCEINDLTNLCLTSKLVNQICLRVLYRDVDFEHIRQGSSERTPRDYSRVAQMFDARLKRQQQFIRALLSHPEHGRHVRSLRGRFTASLDSHGKDKISEEKLWRAMRSLTNIQKVDVGFPSSFIIHTTTPAEQIANGLFHSATSVRLVGIMQYHLARSILNAVNPAALKHLCLDTVREHQFGEHRMPDGRIIASGAASGLLTSLTGRCTALRTLELRRIGQTRDGYGWDTVAEEASYIEWACFIRSVKSTVQRFTFEQTGDWQRDFKFSDPTDLFRVMDERFRRYVVPAILSGSWLCLNIMDLRGVRHLNGEIGKAALKRELKVVLGENAEIVVEEQALRTAFLG